MSIFQQNSPLLINLGIPNNSITKFRNQRSHNGHAWSLVESAFQKYIRRGIFDKSLYWVVQGFLMTSQTLRSTLVNRLIIILTEDISISDAWLIPLSHEIIEKYRILTPDTPPDQEDLRDLSSLIFLYCLSKKSRLGSNVNNFYQNYLSLAKNDDYKKYFPGEGETLDSLLNKNDDADLERRMRVFKFISPKEHV